MGDSTQTFDFDVVIVGASFAGAACALAAAQRGLRVCVLERKRDPGEKLHTTGIIVKEAAERTMLGQIPSALTRRVEGVRLYSPRLKQLAPGPTRAGLIPCDGPVAELARDRAILTGDAAGIVSPVTAGGIHSAWNHGWDVGRAIAAFLRDGGKPAELAAVNAAPRFRTKRMLRWAFDHFQFDWPFDLFLHTTPLRRAAEYVYFHRRKC